MTYHEPWDALPDETREIHRAIRSLVEELEAIDWYHQRVAVSHHPALAAIMAHNRDEEIEHACMALEWLRRSMNGWDPNLRRYLFTTADVTAIEASEDEPDATGSTSGDLGIGRLSGSP